MFTSTRIALAALALSATTLAYAPDAAACGGLFCNAIQPVNQAAERIIFSKNADGSVTAVVQILYEGPAEQFAWVLPVPGIPEVGVSSDHVFTQLQQMTNPQYTLNVTVEGECADDSFLFQNNAPQSADGGQRNNGGGVVVLASGNVGPYDYTVLSVDPALPQPVDVALNWLSDNGYDVSALGPDLLAPYLDKGDNFIAFKLTKGPNDTTGDIRPVTLKYDTEQPCIPIKLTAVAANDDMGVLTWVLGEARAVPINYKSLVLNEALLNWFNPASNYNDVVTEAANEATGQGFVTEYASPTSELSLDPIWSDDADTWWDSFAGTTGVTAAEALDEVCQRIVFFDPVTFDESTWDGWTDVVDDQFAELPDEERDFIKRCRPESFGPWTIADPSTWDFAAFAALVQELVIDPVRDTTALFAQRPYVTRLYTTMSAGDMTVDPMFDYNSDLGDQSNVHTADQTIHCDAKWFQGDAPWTITLANGSVVRGNGRSWPFATGSMMPANEFIQTVGTRGAPATVTDNAATIAQMLESHNGTVTDPPPSQDLPGGGDPPQNEPNEPGPKAEAGGGCCSTVGRTPSSGAILVLLVGLVAFARRRPRSAS